MATPAQLETNFSDKVHTLTADDQRRGREARWQRYRERRDEIEREAKERAAAAMADALEAGGEQLVHLALYGESEQVRLAATRDLLDRFGLKSADRLELTGKDGDAIQVERSDLDPELVIRKLSEIGLVRGREQS